VLVLPRDVQEVARHRSLVRHVVLEVLLPRVVHERKPERRHGAGELRDVAEVPAVPCARGPVGGGGGVVAELHHELGRGRVHLVAVGSGRWRGGGLPRDEAAVQAGGLVKAELRGREQRVGRVVEALPQSAWCRGVGGVQEDKVAAVLEHGGGVRGGCGIGWSSGPGLGLGGSVDDDEVAVVGDAELRRGGCAGDDWVPAVGHPHRGQVGHRGEPHAEVPPVRRRLGCAVGSAEEAERELAVVGDEPVVAGEDLAGREHVRRGGTRREEEEADYKRGQRQRHGANPKFPTVTAKRTVQLAVLHVEWSSAADGARTAAVNDRGSSLKKSRAAAGGRRGARACACSGTGHKFIRLMPMATIAVLHGARQ
jgi:hypothetical protein